LPYDNKISNQNVFNRTTAKEMKARTIFLCQTIIAVEDGEEAERK
jgi:hypothetical protein